MINRVSSESLILALAQQVAVAVVAGLKKKYFIRNVRKQQMSSFQLGQQMF